MFHNQEPPKSDWHLISPYNITPESNIEIKRIQGNNYQLKELLIVIQILLVNTIGNVQRTVQRACILTLRCKGLSNNGCIIIKKARVWKWYWLNNIDNIISVVSMGRFVKNKILLGCSGAATAACTGVGMAVAPKQNQQSINNQNY